MLSVIFSSKIAFCQNVYYTETSRLFSHFKSMDLFLYDMNFYEQKECLNRIFVFDYSCQAFSTLKINKRQNNLFESWKLITSLAKTFFFGEKNLAVLQRLLLSTWALNFALNFSKQVMRHATFIVLSKYLSII